MVVLTVSATKEEKDLIYVYLLIALANNNLLLKLSEGFWVLKHIKSKDIAALVARLVASRYQLATILVQ
jgi:hypothetical protein